MFVAPGVIKDLAPSGEKHPAPDGSGDGEMNRILQTFLSQRRENHPRYRAIKYNSNLPHRLPKDDFGGCASHGCGLRI